MIGHEMKVMAKSNLYEYIFIPTLLWLYITENRLQN